METKSTIHESLNIQPYISLPEEPYTLGYEGSSRCVRCVCTMLIDPNIILRSNGRLNITLTPCDSGNKHHVGHIVQILHVNVHIVCSDHCNYRCKNKDIDRLWLTPIAGEILKLVGPHLCISSRTITNLIVLSTMQVCQYNAPAGRL